VLSIVATVKFDEVQLATDVTSTVDVPPARRLYVPIASYCCVSPWAIVVVAGVIVIDCKERLTVKTADAETPPNVAVIVVVPSDKPVATPAALTVATVVFDEDQPAVAVASVIVPSL
jgi:hypothetical protein